jgi:hypothetical protein
VLVRRTAVVEDAAAKEADGVTDPVG